MTYSPSYLVVTVLLLILSAGAGGTSAFFMNHNAAASSDDNLKKLYTANTLIAFLGCSSFVISFIKIWTYNSMWRGEENKFNKHPMAFRHLKIDAAYVFVFFILWLTGTVLLGLQVKLGCPPVDYCYLGYITFACAFITTVLYIASAIMLYWAYGLTVKLRTHTTKEAGTTVNVMNAVDVKTVV